MIVLGCINIERVAESARLGLLVKDQLACCILSAKNRPELYFVENLLIHETHLLGKNGPCLR